MLCVGGDRDASLGVPVLDARHWEPHLLREGEVLITSVGWSRSSILSWVGINVSSGGHDYTNCIY